MMMVASGTAALDCDQKTAHTWALCGWIGVYV